MSRNLSKGSRTTGDSDTVGADVLGRTTFVPEWRERVSTEATHIPLGRSYELCVKLTTQTLAVPLQKVISDRERATTFSDRVLRSGSNTTISS